MLYEIFNEGKYELLSDNKSTKPDSIHINVTNIQYSISNLFNSFYLF